MSAKTAADALMAFDTTLTEQVQKLYEGHQYHASVRDEDKAALIREVAGTWTLSLAASAAGVSEQQVLIALARGYLHAGTQMAASGFVSAALDCRI